MVLFCPVLEDGGCQEYMSPLFKGWQHSQHMSECFCSRTDTLVTDDLLGWCCTCVYMCLWVGWYLWSSRLRQIVRHSVAAWNGRHLWGPCIYRPGRHLSYPADPAALQARYTAAGLCARLRHCQVTLFSSDVCLEVRGEIIRTLLFCIVYWSCAQCWTWWNWSLVLRTCLPSVLWHCWLGHLTRKMPFPIRPIMCLVRR